MVKTILKWLILIILFAYITIATIWANGQSRLNSCKGINVEVAGTTTADSVTAIGVEQELAKYPRKIVGTPLPRLNTKDIETYLGRYSNFENVECAVSTDGILNISIVPMIPELRVFDKDKSYYINKDGKRIESKANFFVDVPVVTGNFTPEFTPEMLLPVSRFIRNDSILSKLVGMIEAKDADNIILVPRIHGHVINFGDTCRLEEKRKALMAVYRRVMPYKGWNEYDTISLRFRGLVVASRHNKNPNIHGIEADDEIDPEEATLLGIEMTGESVAATPTPTQP